MPRMQCGRAPLKMLHTTRIRRLAWLHTGRIGEDSLPLALDAPTHGAHGNPHLNLDQRGVHHSPPPPPPPPPWTPRSAVDGKCQWTDR